MQEIDAETVRALLDYDPETGVFRWKERPQGPQKWNTRYAGKIAGSIAKSGYLYIQLGKGRHVSGQRLAWIHYHGYVPVDEVDHRHGDRGDNRIAELRLATDGQNATNKAMQRNNTSGVVGVYFEKGPQKWRVRVNFRGKTYEGGLYLTIEEAAAARDKLAAEVHGEFAVTDAADRKKYPHHRDPKPTD